MFNLETIRTKISLTTLVDEAGAHFDKPQPFASAKHWPGISRIAADASHRTIVGDGLSKRYPQKIATMSSCLKSLKSLNDFKPPPQNGRETVRLLRQ